MEKGRFYEENFTHKEFFGNYHVRSGATIAGPYSWDYLSFATDCIVERIKEEESDLIPEMLDSERITAEDLATFVGFSVA